MNKNIIYKNEYYQIIRETKCFVIVKPYKYKKYEFYDNGVTYISMGDKIEIKKMLKELENFEVKINKKHLSPENIITEDEINEILNSDEYYINNNKKTGYKDSLFCESKYKEIEYIYQLTNLIYSITTAYILNQLNNNDDNVKQVHISLVKKFQSELKNNKMLKYTIDRLKIYNKETNKIIDDKIIEVIKFIDDYKL
jgi:hypothetical protein